MDDWKKYLTREFSFLYISYSVHCYKVMKKITGVNINYDFAHGKNNLVTLYGNEKDLDKCYKDINRIISAEPKKVIKLLDDFESTLQEFYKIIGEIKERNERKDVKILLFKLDDIFVKALSYYLFLVYMGYGGDKPDIEKFINKHRKKYEKLRNVSIDTDMVENFPKLFSKYDNKLEKISPYLSRNELLGYLDGTKINKSKINNRKKEYLVITKAGITKEYNIKDIKRILRNELSQQNVKTNELKGRVACEGKAQGIARIVFAKSDYKKIREGDILITPMTKPNIVPYLSKVKAIVTNDGGMTCHASIISRELDIPCIVGTEHVTDIIKDGDIVEVDAEKGIVKKV